MKTLSLAVAAALGFGPVFAVHRASDGASTLLDLDSVLGTSIDGVEDAPEFVTPPAGNYLLGVQKASAEKYKTTNKETMEEEERVRIRLTYQVMKTVELANAQDDQPVADGSLFSEQFMTNPEGLSYFKRQAKNILGEEAIKGVSIGEILNELGNGHSFTAEVRIKKTKGKDATGQPKVFENVQVRIKNRQEPDLPA